VIDIVEAVASLDYEPELHLARLLILLEAFGEHHGEVIEGLTKLAKLDFLLRYPVLLERALEAKGRSSAAVGVLSHERSSVESTMVRYRFGPWDHRYREFLNVLVGRGLATVGTEGRTIVIGLTDLGRRIAAELKSVDSFRMDASRASILKRSFDNKASYLMNFIYETFPEILTLSSGGEIRI